MGDFIVYIIIMHNIILALAVKQTCISFFMRMFGIYQLFTRIDNLSIMNHSVYSFFHTGQMSANCYFYNRIEQIMNAGNHRFWSKVAEREYKEM